MTNHLYRGELVFSGHTGEIIGGGCEIEATNVKQAKLMIAEQLGSGRPKVWLRILEDGVEVDFQEIPDSRRLPQVGGFC